MFSYRLEVHSQQESENPSKCISRGTAWAITDDVIVTAFHVVSDWPKKYWLSDIEEDCIYLLSVNSEIAEFEPLACDSECDVALLRRKRSSYTNDSIKLDVLEVGDWGATVGDSWTAPGFATIAGRAIQTLSGTVTSVWPGDSKGEFELSVDQGGSTSWEGASGSPLCINDQVVGLLITEVPIAGSFRAAGVESALRLLRVCEFSELRKRIIELILNEPPSRQLQLAEQNCNKGTHKAADDHNVAAAIVDDAARYGTLSILKLLAELDLSDDVAELIREIVQVATRPTHRRWPRVLSNPGHMWEHHFGYAPPTLIENAWNKFLDQVPWHIYIKELTQEISKGFHDLIVNQGETSNEARQLQRSFAGFDVSRPYRTIHRELERLNANAVNWLNKENTKPGAPSADRKTQFAFRRRLTRLQHLFKPETPRGRCFLLMGSTGSGKTHFIEWALNGNPNSFESPLILPITLHNIDVLTPKSIEDTILGALNTATGRCFRSLREFQKTLDNLRHSHITYLADRAKTSRSGSRNDPRLIIAFDELHRILLRGAQGVQLFESLQVIIEETTAYPSIYWLVTLRDAQYDQIPTSKAYSGAPNFWEQYGVVGSFGERPDGIKPTPRDCAVPAKAGWIDVDLVNTRNEVGTIILRKWLGDSQFDALLTELSANHKSTTYLRYLHSPWFAWFLTSLEKTSVSDSLASGDLHYITLVERLHSTRLNAIGVTEEDRREIQRYVRAIAAALIPGDGRRRDDEPLVADIKQHSARLHYPFASDVLRCHLTNLLQNNLLNKSEEGYHDYFEIDLEMLWSYEGARYLCEELVGKDETIIASYLINQLSPNPNDMLGMKEGVLEFMVMIADRTSSPLVQIIVDLVLTSGILNPAGIAFAAPKVSERLQELIYQTSSNQSLLTGQAVADRRILLAWLMFIERSSAEAIRPDERLSFMRNAYEAIFKNGFSKYYYAVAAKVLSEVSDQSTLRNCMLALRGCEHLQGDCAKHLAEQAIERLFTIASNAHDDDIECEGTILAALDEIFSYLHAGYRFAELEYKARKDKPLIRKNSTGPSKDERSRWSREYFREWILLAFCDRIVAIMGPSKSFRFLHEHGWYSNKRVQNPIAHEMMREANNSIGRYFHSHESELERSVGHGADFLALLSELIESTGNKGFTDRSNAFHLIRHTRPTFGEYGTSINEQLIPFVLRLSEFTEMKANSNFRRFLKANGAEINLES